MRIRNGYAFSSVNNGININIVIRSKPKNENVRKLISPKVIAQTKNPP